MADLDFNHVCADGLPTATLTSLRDRLMIRLGYAAQVANYPPGMSVLLDDFLQSAQVILYAQNPALHTERIFTWTLTAGTRYYNITANDEQDAGANQCLKVLSDYKPPTWVGFQDDNAAWIPMSEGINPTRYTNTTQGRPDSYEIRQGIEIFPAPDSSTYKLRIKGHFGLLAFAIDADTTTLDAELVFTLALGNAKAHYGQRDAQSVLAQVTSYLKAINAGTHGTARYIPRFAPAPVLTRPQMEVFI